MPKNKNKNIKRRKKKKKKESKEGGGRPTHKGRCGEPGANIPWWGGGTRRTMKGPKHEQQQYTIQYGEVRA